MIGKRGNTSLYCSQKLDMFFIFSYIKTSEKRKDVSMAKKEIKTDLWVYNMLKNAGVELDAQEVPSWRFMKL